MGFGEFYIAIQAFKRVIEWSAEHLKQAFEQGFHLYIKGAQLGLSAGTVFQKEVLGSVAGLKEGQIDQYLLRRQYGRGRNSIQAFGTQKSLTGTGDIGNYALARTSAAAAVFDQTAGSLARVMIDAKLLAFNFEALGAQIAYGFSGSLDNIIQGLNWFTEIVEKTGVAMALLRPKIFQNLIDPTGTMALISRIKDYLHPERIGANALKTNPSIGGTHPLQQSAWEHMGLVVGGRSAGENQLKDISLNTKTMADLLEKVLNGKQGDYNLPSYQNAPA